MQQFEISGREAFLLKWATQHEWQRTMQRATTEYETNGNTAQYKALVGRANALFELTHKIKARAAEFTVDADFIAE